MVGMSLEKALLSSICRLFLTILYLRTLIRCFSQLSYKIKLDKYVVVKILSKGKTGENIF